MITYVDLVRLVYMNSTVVFVMLKSSNVICRVTFRSEVKLVVPERVAAAVYNRISGQTRY